MISKNQIKFIRSLHQAKYRRIEKLFIAEGPKVVGELLRSRFTIKSIFALSDWIQENKVNIPESIEVFDISPKDLERISTLVTPNQVMATIAISEFVQPQSQLPIDLTIVLDNIKDPGNMGTIIRTADWFGIDQIVCSENCVDIYNPKVIQATMGSISRVSVLYTNLLEFLSKLPNRAKVYGTLLEGDNIYKSELHSKAYLIIGSESHGISEELKKYITHNITIPTFSSKATGAESLNASVAAAIICSEFRRQSKY